MKNSKFLWIRSLSRAGLTLFFATLPLSVGALTLEQYLDQVQKNNPAFRAQKYSMEASEAKRVAGDSELATVLTLKGSYLDDKNPQSLGSYLLTRTQATDYSAGLAKRFSTGTNVALSAGLTDSELTAASLPSNVSTTVRSGRGSLGLALSQSLWKGGFGRQTDLRREREVVVSRLELQASELEGQRILIEAENAFWDYLYLQDDLKLRKDSLDRAQKIETWVKNRVGNGIGDEADLLNAQSLVASRKFQLIGSEDDLKAAAAKLRTQLGLDSGEVAVEGDLSISRKLSQMSRGDGPVKMRMDTYLAVLESQTKGIVAREVEESFRPDLTLEGQYKTNSSEASLSEAENKITASDKPTQAVALKLTWLIDSDIKGAAQNAAKAESLAAQLRRDQKIRESEDSWRELERRHQEMSHRIQAAQVLSEIQNKKSATQRSKLSKGRSITSDVILAEQDAGESSLNLVKLKSEQRKLETQGRLFLSLDQDLRSSK